MNNWNTVRCADGMVFCTYKRYCSSVVGSTFIHSSWWLVVHSSLVSSNAWPRDAICTVIYLTLCLFSWRWTTPRTHNLISSLNLILIHTHIYTQAAHTNVGKIARRWRFTTFWFTSTLIVIFETLEWRHFGFC